VSSRHKEPPTIKFLIDGMLGSLATKLRILGFDTIYDKDSADAGLIQTIKKDGRTLVTSDQELFLNSKRMHLSVILITKTNDRTRLVELCRQLGLQKLDLAVMPRCSNCNSNLIETSGKDKFGRVLFRCETCRKLYWKGSHWKKLDALFYQVNKELNSEPRNKRILASSLLSSTQD
jgi:uncharacterized protein